MYGKPYKQIYWLSIAVLFIADASRFMTIFKSETICNRSLMAKLTYVSVFLLPVYTHLFIGNNIAWPSKVNNYLRYCENYNLHTKNKKWRRLSVIVALSIMTSFVLSLSLYFVPVWVVMPENIIVGNLHTPFESSPLHVQLGLSAVLTVIRFYGIMFSMCIFGCFCIVCRDLSEKFNMITNELKAMLNGRDNALLHFDELRRQHGALRDVLSDANIILGRVAFCVYASSIP